MKTEEELLNAEEPVMDYNQLDLEGTYSYMDYMRWQFQERVELIRGKIRKMSPGPNVRHQSILSNLSGKLLSHFFQQSCKVYIAPFDVRLPVANTIKGKEHTVVQPDLCIICNSELLDLQGCNGAPDLVIEILSPGNSQHEMDTKYSLYEESGVKEYWMVEGNDRVVLVYSLVNGKYVGLKPFIEGQQIESPLFPELKISVSEVFYDVK